MNTLELTKQSLCKDIWLLQNNGKKASIAIIPRKIFLQWIQEETSIPMTSVVRGTTAITSLFAPLIGRVNIKIIPYDDMPENMLAIVA